MLQRSPAVLLAFWVLATEVALGHGGNVRGPDGGPRFDATCSSGRSVAVPLPRTTARSPRTGAELAQGWDRWWEHNSGPYLEASARAARELASAGSHGRSRRSDSPSLATLTKDQIRTAAVPALRAGLTDPFFDVRSAAVIALGKVLDPDMPEADETGRAMQELLADPERETRESACLGLGLIGDRSRASDLVLILRDQPVGRAITGVPNKPVLVRHRGFAAIGTGLLGMRNRVKDAVTLELIDAAKSDADEDVRVMSLLALGSMRSRLAAPELRRLATNRDGDPVTRAHAIAALGRLSDDSFVGWLTRSGVEDPSSEVQRSSVIALGLLASREDGKAVDVLIRRAQWAADRPVRSFALIALGQIGSPAARLFLLQKAGSGNQHDRSFAALGLGVSGAKWADGREALGDALLRKWGDVRDEVERGAFAIALGLLSHEPAAPVLAQALRSAEPGVAKGWLVTALGLLGARDAAPLIRPLAADQTDAEVRRRAREALGLLGDPGDAGVLLEAIRNRDPDLSAMGGAVAGLAWLGRKEVVPALCEMLTRREAHHDYARAFAAVALGSLGDKDPLPPLASLRADCNYLASTEGLRELARIF